MKFQSWKNKTIGNRRPPETAIPSCAASILVLGCAIALMTSPPLQASHANRQPCTVIIDCVEQPIVLHQLLESEGNYTRIHFKSEHALVARSLNALENRLDPKVFFRANRKQMVNLRWVQSIHPWFSRGLRIKLRSGTEVEISRRKSQQFRDLASL
jgi:hypothetical protein